MSERMRTIVAAYRKGHLEAKKSNSKYKRNPYGETKKELQMWWNAGFNDTKSGNIDFNLINNEETDE